MSGREGEGVEEEEDWGGKRVSWELRDRVGEVLTIVYELSIESLVEVEESESDEGERERTGYLKRIDNYDRFNFTLFQAPLENFPIASVLVRLSGNLSLGERDLFPHFAFCEGAEKGRGKGGKASLAFQKSVREVHAHPQQCGEDLKAGGRSRRRSTKIRLPY